MRYAEVAAGQHRGRDADYERDEILGQLADGPGGRGVATGLSIDYAIVSRRCGSAAG